jgi:CTD kinase subunit gamma
LIGLQNKGFLEHQAVTQIEDVIKERGTNDDDLGLDSPNGDVEMSDAPASESKSRRRPTTHGLDKRQVEQRIEEDRERHKRERERIWAVPKGDDAEMTKLWEETSDFGDDDDRLLTEEGDDFTKEMEMQQCQHLQATNGNHH